MPTNTPAITLGKQWQVYVVESLKEFHRDSPTGTTNVIDMPDRTQGDGGIDALVRSTGQLFQCYFPEDPVSATDVNGKVRSKIRTDIEKFIAPEFDATLLTGVRIREWVLVTPHIYDKSLIAYCGEEQARIRQLNLPYVDSPNFRISIATTTDIEIWNKGRKPQPPVLFGATPWGKAVWEHPLWNESDSLFRRKAAHIANHCFAWGNSAQPANPWRDPGFPERALTCAGLLVGNLPDPCLSAREIALLLTAPLLRHAAQSLTEAKAYEHIFHPQHSDEDAARAWSNQCKRKPQWTRKMERLLLPSSSATDKESGQLVRFWMLHETVRRQAAAWSGGNEGLLPDEFLTEIKKIGGWTRERECCDPQQDIFNGLNSPFLLARSVDFDPSELLSREDRLPRNKRITVQMRNIDTLHLAKLAVLSALAQRMALDPLLLPEVIVDHVGLQDPVAPTALHAHAGNAQWDTPELTLQVACRHPAIDLAFSETVTQLNSLRARVLTAYAHNSSGLEALPQIPAFSDRGVAPDCDEGIPLYHHRPHIHFTLSNDEVRELLMGEQLYGDPALAIRELYQNALDACRYRQAREEYQSKIAPDGIASNWQGEILIEQGTDALGRSYIQCSDNGIGMSERELRNCFARAGRRFVDSEDYIEEAAQWHQVGIEHFPNSQFGVGVFSYFMLAEEIHVATWRASKGGETHSPLLATISGSGSLFRVKDAELLRKSPPGTPFPEILKTRQHPGSTVRLYLNRENGKYDEPISALETLNELLRVAEFDTAVRKGGQAAEWIPNDIHGQKNEGKTLIHDGRDYQIWWAESGSELLADGIVVPVSYWIPGPLVVNLRKGQRPELTTDRKDVRHFDEGFIKSIVQKYGADALLKHGSHDFSWLTKVGKSFPVVLHDYMTRVGQKGDPYPINWERGQFDMLSHGLFPLDDDIHSAVVRFDRDGDKSSWNRLVERYPQVLLASRLRFMEKAGVIRIGSEFTELFDESGTDSQTITGKLGPIASFLIENIDFEDRPEHHEAPYRVDCFELLSVAHELQLSVATCIEHLRSLTIFGIDINITDTASLTALPQPNNIDIKLLSRDLDGRAPWLDDTVSPFHLLRAAAKFALPVSECFTRLRRFSPLGIELALPENVDFDSVPHPDEIDIKLLSRDLDGRAPWLDGTVPPVHLLQAAAKLALPVSECVTRLRRFSPLGIELALPENIDLGSVPQPDEIDIKLLSRNLNGQTVSPVHLLQAAAKLALPVSECVTRLRRFSPLGIELALPENVDLGSVPQPDEIDITILSRDLDGQAPWLDDTVSPDHLLRAAAKLALPVSECLQRLERFTPLGLILPNS